jgi:polyhydroxyalkanoate synthesis regulator phasin
MGPKITGVSEPSDKQRSSPSLPQAEAVGDALRQAVDRTLAATAEGASGTRQRAQDLLDDAVRRGQGARDRVAKRGEEATSRLAEAISELRSVDDESIGGLAAKIEDIERRLSALEAAAGAKSNPKVEVEESPSAPLEQRDSEV